MAILGLLIFAVLIAVAAYNADFHIGFAALFAALVYGVFACGLSVDEILARFPTKLFLTLVVVTLLFAIAETNGTLAIIAERSLLLCRGKTRLVPLIVFALSFILSALGVGNIAATALIAPTAMVLAGRIGLNAFLMSLVVVGGANSASLSPFSMTGILLSELMQKAMPETRLDLIQHSVIKIFFLTFVLVTLAHLMGFLACGGLKWWRASGLGKADSLAPHSPQSMSWSQRMTFGAIIAFACGILMGNSPAMIHILGSAWHALGSQIIAVALGLIALLMFARLVKTDLAISNIPWSTILLVSGVVTYLGVLEYAGAISWASEFIHSNPIFGGMVPSMAFASATLSSISSSSGVVLPLFVPMVPELSSNSVDTISLIATVAVSAHLVDCSPFSTLGALCLASAKEGQVEGQEKLFRMLLIWGLIMIPSSVILLGALSFSFSTFF